MSKEFEGPSYIETRSKEEIPEEASPWLAEIANGGHAGSGCVWVGGGRGCQNHVGFEAAIRFIYLFLEREGEQEYEWEGQRGTISTDSELSLQVHTGLDPMT